ncbi:hypothetical protein, partial [Kitasatospora sp. MBT63]|uniref:2-oxoglutarate dehydrogenase E1 subunit family protein n=1 Tax=Kitasatospora sp. MBT63 TaxID=1444768 RepID=UPI0034CD07C6
MPVWMGEWCAPVPTPDGFLTHTFGQITARHCDLGDAWPPGTARSLVRGVALIPAVHHPKRKRKRAVAPMSPHPETPSSSASSTTGFGPNEWLVDEIYQQYLQDPNSVDRAWWDFFADYKPGTEVTSVTQAATPVGPTPTTVAAPAAPAAAAPAAPAPAVPAPAPVQPAPAPVAA